MIFPFQKYINISEYDYSLFKRKIPPLMLNIIIYLNFPLKGHGFQPEVPLLWE